MMPLYKTAFTTGSFADANNCVTVEKTSSAERWAKCHRAVKTTLDYRPDEIIPLSKTACSMRNIGDKN
ncbi:MAG: hypothetical protein AUK31_04825 [Fibrobacteres bacterium CG2_30_45_31]|nr:MAG: hypothetical protein AUK31_04825 [Fibrobacteres bacterium CG2_30_45_31]